MKRGHTLSFEDKAGIDAILVRLTQNLRAAATVFMTGDVRAARVLANEKTIFRDIEAKAMELHFQILRDNKIDAIETRTLYLDLVRDLKSVNDRLVAGAAYPILENLGELRMTRLRSKSATPPDKSDPKEN